MIPYSLVRVRKEKTYVAFNPVFDKDRDLDFPGYRILEHCDGERRPEDIANTLAAEMQWDQDASLTYVTDFLNDMTREGMIAWREQPIYKVKISTPVQVFWDITSRCNLRCVHCYNSEGNPHGQELSTEEVQRTLEEMHRSGVQNIIYTGGEPFLRKDFTELLVFTASLGFAYVSVATNGTLLDRDTAAQLKQPNVHIQVSIDGDTAEVHDRMRGKQGSFDQALHAMKILLEEGVRAKACTTLTNLNLDRVPKIIDLMHDQGIENYRFQGLVISGRNKMNANIRIPLKKAKNLVEYLVGRNLDPGGLSFTLNPPPDKPVDFNSSLSCSGGISTCSITSDGRVVPCTYFFGMNGDNVRNHSFQWIWENSPLLNYFRNIKLDEIKGHCRECAWLMRCRGGCRAECYLDGDLFGSNRFCWVAEENAEKRLTEQPLVYLSKV